MVAMPASRSSTVLRRQRRSRGRWLVGGLLTLGAFAMWPSEALAGPPGAGGSVGGSTNGQAGGKSSGFELPDFVYGGNAVSVLMPMQFGLTARGYVPRVRLGIQYDRQIVKGHWVYLQAAALLDNGNFQSFKMDDCGFDADDVAGACGRGTVAGVDITAGYTYKFYVEKNPWIVPQLRAGLGWGWWRYPRLSSNESERLQTRRQSFALTVRAGGGLRFFLLKDLALGVDVNFQFGFNRHRDILLNGDVENSTDGLVVIEALPALLEYRF